MAAPQRAYPRPPSRPGGWAPYNPFPRGTPANDNFNRLLRQGSRRFPWLLLAKTLYDAFRWYAETEELFRDYEICWTNLGGSSGSFCNPASGLPEHWGANFITCAQAPAHNQCVVTFPSNRYASPTLLPNGTGAINQFSDARDIGSGIWGSILYQVWRPKGGVVVPDPTQYTAPGVISVPPNDPNLPPAIDQPGTVPSPIPWWDPNSIPPLVYEPVPRPVPYPVIPSRPVNDPDKVPGERNESWQPSLRPRVRRMPYKDVELSPRGQRSPRIRHRLRPAGKGVKERKLIGNFDPASVIGRGLSQLTEFNDLVNCLHDALPRSMKSYQNAQSGRAAAVYRNFEHIDVSSALMGCLAEQIEDVIFGTLGKRAAQANRQLGLTGGTIGRTQGNIRRATK